MARTSAWLVNIRLARLPRVCAWETFECVPKGLGILGCLGFTPKANP